MRPTRISRQSQPCSQSLYDSHLGIGELIKRRNRVEPDGEEEDNGAHSSAFSPARTSPKQMAQQHPGSCQRPTRASVHEKDASAQYVSLCGGNSAGGLQPMSQSVQHPSAMERARLDNFDPAPYERELWMRREVLDDPKSIRPCDMEVSTWQCCYCVLQRNLLDVRSGSTRDAPLLVRLDLENIRAVSYRVQDDAEQNEKPMRTEKGDNDTAAPDFPSRFIIQVNTTIRYAFASKSADEVKEWTFRLQKAMATIIGRILQNRERKQGGFQTDLRSQSPQFDSYRFIDDSSSYSGMAGIEPRGDDMYHTAENGQHGQFPYATSLAIRDPNENRLMSRASPGGESDDDDNDEEQFAMSPDTSRSDNDGDHSARQPQACGQVGIFNSISSFGERAGACAAAEYHSNVVQEEDRTDEHSTCTGEILGDGVTFEMHACNNQRSNRRSAAAAETNAGDQRSARPKWVPPSLRKKREEEWKAGRREHSEAPPLGDDAVPNGEEMAPSGDICPTILDQRDRICRMLESSEDVESGTHAVVSCCGVREKMEDAHTISEYIYRDNHGPFSFYAVYDGHGGNFVAQHAAERIYKYVSDSPAFPHRPEQALEEAFQTVDQEIKNLWEQATTGDKRRYECGSTATCAILDYEKQRLIISSLGDSQAVLWSNGTAVELSAKHTPSNEKHRIEEAGGWVWSERQIVLENVRHLDVGDTDVRRIAEEASRHDRVWPECSRVNGELGVSRALGDIIYKYPLVNEMPFCWPKNHTKRDPPFSDDLVLSQPDCHTRTLKQGDEFLILACDGLFDVLSAEQALDICDRHLSKQGPLAACRRLVEVALKLGSEDNITCLLVILPTAIKHAGCRRDNN
eukprot:gb/GECG01006286.1/.p1 GENE.gb/GECG01006286.1/~~gb/GECG01006286.1/.p1  ORF type:complete len:856 (+),score=109.60 gb/GECG01006286.1/:1-2568(+)